MQFEEQVEALTGIAISGSSNPTQTELSAFLQDGVKDVANRMIEARPAELSKFTATTNSTSSITKTGKILSVVREHDSTDILRKCTAIDPGDRYDATDTESLNYRSKTSPGFYELAGSIHTVPPAASGNNDIIVTQVSYDAGVVFGDTVGSGIDNFPTEYEHLVGIYASIQSLKAKMSNSIISIVAVPPDVPTITASTVSFSTAAPSYASPTQTISGTDWDTAYPDEYTALNIALGAMTTELNKVDNILSTAEDKVDAYYTDIGDIDDTTELWDLTNKRFSVVRDALNYAGNLIDGNKPNQEYDAAQNLLDVNAALDGMQAHLADGETVLGASPGSGDIYTALTAINTNVDLANTVIDTVPVPPDVPTAPSFTTPAITSSTVSSTFDPTSNGPAYTPPKVGGTTEELTTSMGTGSSKTDFSDWFDQVGDYIETDEDVELAGAQLQKISAYLQSYSNAMQNQLNEFNEANVEYQAELQQAITQAQINAQEYQQEASLLLQKEQQEYSSKLQKYSAEVSEYQAEVSAMTAQAQGYLNTAQGYVGEVQARISYATAYQQASAAREAEGGARINQLNATVSVAAQELQRANLAIAEINTIMASYRLDIEGVAPYLQTAQGYIGQAAGYANEVQALLSQVPAKVSEYQAKLQDALNEFNDDNAEYQAELQVSIQNAQLEDSEEAKKLQKYSAEVAEYQAEVNTEIQEKTTKVQQYKVLHDQLLLDYNSAFGVTEAEA